VLSLRHPRTYHVVQCCRRDVASSTDVTLGKHAAAVKCVEYSADHGVVLTGSWDRTVKAWDARTSSAAGPVASYDVADRVYSASLAGRDTLLVATAGRHIHMLDLRKLRAPTSSDAPAYTTRESTLKHQTRCIRAFPDGTGYATSSIEGRIAIDYVVDAALDAQRAKYAFKCHRTKLPNGEERVFPVNALAFHPGYGTFASGGEDLRTRRRARPPRTAARVWTGAACRMQLT
jgi:cell cycle arrest protein BUB3